MAVSVVLDHTPPRALFIVSAHRLLAMSYVGEDPNMARPGSASSDSTKVSIPIGCDEAIHELENEEEDVYSSTVPPTMSGESKSDIPKYQIVSTHDASFDIASRWPKLISLVGSHR